MADIDAYYDAMKVTPPCMKMKECNSKCYYYNECWPEEQEEDED